MHGIAGLADPRLRCAMITSKELGRRNSPQYLRRLISTVSHEVCHVIGIWHCEFYACVMNEGTESIKDNDGVPNYLCPMCEAKLLIGFKNMDRMKRYEDLLEFAEEYELEEEAAQYQRLIAYHEKKESEEKPTKRKRSADCMGTSSEASGLAKRARME